MMFKKSSGEDEGGQKKMDRKRQTGEEKDGQKKAKRGRW
jgi:hypothetical protein